MALDWTVSHIRPNGRRKCKDSITVLVCANSDGSEKVERMFIGNAVRPRAIKNKIEKDYGLYYRANRNAWIKSILFFDWIKHFEDSFRNYERKVLFLSDNCSAHGSLKIFGDLQSVELYLLRPDITFKLLQSDAGIITFLNVLYRNYQMDQDLDMDQDENVSVIYKMKILSILCAFKRIQLHLEASVTANCWKHAETKERVA